MLSGCGMQLMHVDQAAHLAHKLTLLSKFRAGQCSRKVKNTHVLTAILELSKLFLHS